MEHVRNIGGKRLFVFNATPLIYLAKARRAELLGDLADERALIIPSSVHEEVVVVGQQRGEPDARRIGNLVESGVLELMGAPSTPLAQRLSENGQLHEAERDTLVIAADQGGRAILDETYGRQVAGIEGIPHGGTIYVLLDLVKRGAITPEQARETVDKIIHQGWFCSTSLYTRIVRKLDSM